LHKEMYKYLTAQSAGGLGKVTPSDLKAGTSE